ncbi:hypothetical protein THRCLA_07239 [Thraustotheca clavata]|uniref:BZIP domain-containing protein n=1 Tax=Thraustotheca clavata TaxID=74557 RepID=A0A1V9ZFB8_9STRA|nr:hypothetical protein THRCLA_07239 [Thraustotheca clavata]
MSSNVPTKRKVSERRQIQCRNNQRRYREQARNYMNLLERQVTELQHETARLEGHVDTWKSTLKYRLLRSSHSNDLERVREYWQVMATGYATQDPSYAARQIALIKNLMTEDVDLVGSHGIQKFIEQRQQYAYTFQSIHKAPYTFEVIPINQEEHIIRSTGSLILGVNEETIRVICPQIISNQRLVSRLVGQKLLCPLQMTFYMSDNGHGSKAYRLETSLDFTSGLLGLLGNLMDVVEVMNGAHINGSGEIMNTRTIPIVPAPSLPAAPYMISKRIYRQMQCRNNRRKYRAEAKAHLEMLEHSVEHLTKETVRLEGHLESLSLAVM